MHQSTSLFVTANIIIKNELSNKSLVDFMLKEEQL